MTQDHYIQESLDADTPQKQKRWHGHIPDGYSRCSRCGQIKPLDAFYPSSSRPRGVTAHCIPCRRAYSAEYYRANEDYRTKSRYRLLESKYGVDKDLYDRIFTEQGGLCAICKSPPPELRPFHLDHDHVTGKPRGLLCARCNSMLTHFGDRPEGLLRILAYVERGNER